MYIVVTGFSTSASKSATGELAFEAKCFVRRLWISPPSNIVSCAAGLLPLKYGSFLFFHNYPHVCLLSFLPNRCYTTKQDWRIQLVSKPAHKVSKPAYPSEVCLAGWAKGLSMTFKRKPGYPVHWFSYNSTLKSLIVFLASPPRVPYESLKEFKWKLLFSLLTTCFTQALKPWLWLPLPRNERLLRLTCELISDP